MAQKGTTTVTMRVRLGDSELEVTGPTQFVEEKINEFVERQRNVGTRATSALRHGTEPARDAPSDLARKGTSVAQFFRSLSLKTDVDRVLAAGYYLEKNKNVDNFTTAEVAQTIRDAKRTPPTNVSDCIARNIKKGFIMGSGDKDGTPAYVLTTDGEDAVSALKNA